MRVNSTRSAGSSSGVKKKDTKKASGEFSSLLGASEASSAESTGGISQISSVDAILAAQAVGDEGEANKKHAERGHELLDMLEDLRDGLYEGRITVSSLERLAQGLKLKHDISDPKLKGIIDEIETRAAVELAKLEKGLI